MTSKSEIKKARILVVGAGGIGCELLKNLAIHRFENLDVLDLDTIDPTNLNRQLLFRRDHVGRPKAEVAVQTLLKVNPNCNAKSHHGDVKSRHFGQEFFSKFDLVLNALDNRDARRHVNRICSHVGRPLIESGSTGFNGQVVPIIIGSTECYDCNQPPKQTSYPICTIRSTPDKPEHCVAWSKLLFDIVFGPDDDSNFLADLKSAISRCSPLDAGNDSSNTEQKRHAAEALEFGGSLFTLIFHDDIVEQIPMIQAAEGKTPPRPLSHDQAKADANPASPEVLDASLPPDHLIWDVKKNRRMFLDSVVRIQTNRRGDIGLMQFDKDDTDAMDFVAAASNLRMHNYSIPLMSRWSIQSIAGAIVPAIASTNAIVAGMQVIQALHLLRWLESHEMLLHQIARIRGLTLDDTAISRLKITEDLSDAAQRELRSANIRTVWVRQSPAGRFILLPEALAPPNARCFVCGQRTILVALQCIANWTVGGFVREILRNVLSCSSPLLDVEETGVCIFDPEMEDSPEDYGRMLAMPLSEAGVRHGSTIGLTDFMQGNFQCDILIVEAPCEDPDDPRAFSVKVPTPKEQPLVDADDVANKKRKLDESGGASAGDATKKPRFVAETDDDDDDVMEE